MGEKRLSFGRRLRKEKWCMVIREVDNGPSLEKNGAWPLVRREVDNGPRLEGHHRSAGGLR